MLIRNTICIFIRVFLCFILVFVIVLLIDDFHIDVIAFGGAVLVF